MSMSGERLVKTSKRLSLILRHAPERAGLTLDAAGWVDVDAVLSYLQITRAELDAVVKGNDKRRFTIDGDRIRANQGHTITVDLQLEPAAPPSVLFHGTHPGALDAIARDGLLPMKRHDVHLSADHETAVKVGARRGRPVVLQVDAERMAVDGHEFRRSANGVWLTAAVPPTYLTFPPKVG